MLGKQFTACLLSISFSAPAFAGAWLQAPGHGEFIGNATYFASDQYYDRSGNRSSQPQFTKFEFQPYIEYGLSRYLTVGGSMFLQRVEQSDKNNYGIADPEVFLRTQLYRDDRNVVSLQPLVKFASSFLQENAPRGGSGNTDAELSLLYGRNLKILSPRDYADIRVGYRARSNDVHDQIRADAALGLQLSDRWSIIPAVRYVKATSLGSATAFSENGKQNFDLLKIELGGKYELSATNAMYVSVFDHVAGKQTGDGEGVSIGYAVKF